MKIILALACMLQTGILLCQDIKPLDPVRKSEQLKDGKSIICGNFIQRLGFSSGGFPQDIILLHLDSMEFVKFRVKPAFKSKKENQFCFHIDSGKYVIFSYLWTKSQWYGWINFGEPIIKNLNVIDYIEENKEIPDELIEDMSLRYTFTVESGQIMYVGTWNFEDSLASFTDDRNKLVSVLDSKYRRIELESSMTFIPE